MRTPIAIFALTLTFVACDGDPFATPSDDGGNDAAVTPDAPLVDAATDALADGASVGDTIQGTVLRFESDVPAKSIAITLVDATDTPKKTISGLDGSFSIPNVVAPYSVSLVDPADTSGFVWVWHGLTITKPTLALRDATPTGPAHSVNASCHAVASGFCASGGCGVGATAFAPATSTDSAATGSFQLGTAASGQIDIPISVSWFGTSTSRNVLLSVVAWDQGSFSFLSGAAQVTVIDGAPFICQSALLLPVQAPTFMVADVVKTNLGAGFQGQGWFTFDLQGGGVMRGRSFDLPHYASGIPAINVGNWRSEVETTDPSTGWTATAKSADIAASTPTGLSAPTLYGPATPTSPPVQGGSVSSSGSLAWSDGSGPAVYELGSARIADGGATYFRIYTSQTSVPLPLLKKLGAGVDPAPTFSFYLTARRPATTLDAFVAGPKAPRRFDFLSQSSSFPKSFSVVP